MTPGSAEKSIGREKQMNRPRFWLTSGAACGFVTVALGAFGAHGLRDMVSAERLANWATATDYLGLHAIAILACGLWLLQRPDDRLVHRAAGAFLVGILLFSGSLFALVLTDQRVIGMITPIGGLLLLAGWALLVAGARGVRVRSPADSRHGAD
ncbi:Uncharacterized membrane protein YgdD, TMEM256/DUF423 family [Thiocapsa roseopersicina]|uniref:Uncharacterized membrane protein YgdD, TMEM256/DUF423 family n=2 Tax=Thiocapsa roseopersicina TaxID=1058 RepID=A0A1H2V309_THIRO|nr:Uncharacterized membrane protein YgdD, TMEM256/DUF423 family [Thiocapsa roseopersicina]